MNSPIPIPTSGIAARTISIFGSTGSIGKNTIDIIRQHPDKFEVTTLTARNNFAKLIEQAELLNPQQVVIENNEYYNELKSGLRDRNIKISSGTQAITDAANQQVDMAISAITGAAALAPTLAAIRAGSSIGLANKECLVCAGEVFMEEVKKHNTTIIPIDSEHNALFQTLDNAQIDKIKSVTLTASGGPFREYSMEQMQSITPEQAVAHPNWSMGAKISVDSATMMNKGLEIIEAYYLFPFEKAQINTVVHKESVIHSIISYVDGSSVAALSIPDMRVPISYALGWPKRLHNNTKCFDPAALGTLTFEKADEVLFPALRLARQALNEGGTATTILNAANEIAVEHFLAGIISFLDIVITVERVLDNMSFESMQNIEQIVHVDNAARRITNEIIKKHT